LKREAAFKRAENSAPALKETQPGHQDEGKHKAREGSDALTDDSSEDIGLPKTPAGDECKRRIQSFQSRLRECEIVMHQIMFFLGDTYNVLGNAAREEETYAEADDIRKRLLQSKAHAYPSRFGTKLMPFE
jgi:E3 ubiquitin-protein ligase SHPRH